MGNQLVQISTPDKTQTSEPLTAAAPAAADFFPARTSGRGGAGKPFCIPTFGGQMNVHDSAKGAGVLSARGYRPAEDQGDPVLAVYNACSTRRKAADKTSAR